MTRVVIYASGSSASDGEDRSDSEPAMSEVSDQYSMLEHAYQSVRDVFRTTSEGKLVGGDGSLNQLESLPAHWPLAKLTLPLKFGVNRLDGLVVGYLMELMATRSDASKCRKQISSFAKTLTVRVATYLAKEIASLFRPVLYHPLMSLTEDDTLPLLTSEFWVRPVHEELLHAASRFNLSPDAELKRPTSNLVKIASHVKSKPGDAMNQGDQHTTMTDWLGADCPVNFLNVWFPAHWSPIVLRELHGREVKYRSEHMLWFDAPAMASDTARLIAQRRDAVKSRELHFHLGAMDEEKNLPTLIGKLKIDWLDFPVDDILQQFTTLKEGILRGVFKQKAARAWFGCRAEKAQITVLLPGSCSLSEWSEKVDCMPHSWPKSCNIGRMQMGPVQANTFHLHRKFTRARHMWLSLKPDWRLLATHMYTDWPGIHTYVEINDRLFANPGRNDNIQDTPSKAKWHSPAHWQWLGQRDYMWQFVDTQVPPVRITMEKTLAEYRANLRVEQAEIAEHSSAISGKKKWKTKDGIYQLKDPETSEQAMPGTDDAIYADMLRDV